MTNEVFIVAGGPSLIDFNFSLLDGKDVITINNAAFKCPNAKYVYFADLDWFQRWEKQLAAHTGKVIKGSLPQDHEYEQIEKAGIDWVDNWRFTKADGLCLGHKELSTGINSGYAAINLAVQLGYKRVYLLGYDMKWNGEKSNFHTTHTRVTPKEKYADFLRYFPGLVEPLRELGVTVINLTPDSALTVFPLSTFSAVTN